MTLEQLLVIESKEITKTKDGNISKGHRSQLKECIMTKATTLFSGKTNKVILCL
jgi:hypothetical protein